MQYLTSEQVIHIHDQVIEPNELQGQASDKSIEAVLGRIENRIRYGLIKDVYDLAACYGAYIAVAHAFNDANKRTGFQCMDIVLLLNGIELAYNTVEVSDLIVKSVIGQIDENDLAQWLRNQAR